MLKSDRSKYFVLMTAIAAILCNGSYSIQNVRLILPPFVHVDTITTLLCLYDLEGASLYSVQWYRGQFEFFRFVPDEQPQRKAFRVPGLFVDVSASNAHQVTLRNVPIQISGEFTCEVTTDFPRFQTSRASRNLTVVGLDLDVKMPKKKLRFGDIVEANCTLSPKLTMIKLKFYWNVTPIPDDFIKGINTNSIVLTLDSSKFVADKIIPTSVRLTCSAVLENTYYIISKSAFFQLEPSKRSDPVSNDGCLRNRAFKKTLMSAFTILKIMYNLIS